MKTNIDSITIESRRDKSFTYFLIVFAGLFFTVLSILIFVRERQEILLTTYNEIGFLLFVIICGLFPIYYILVVDKIIVDNVRIRIDSYWGYKKREIQLDKIISWNEINVKSKYGLHRKLIFRTDNFKYKIEQPFYSNYYELKNQIVRGKTIGGDTQEMHDKKANYFTVIVTLLVTILILTIYFIDKN